MMMMMRGKQHKEVNFNYMSLLMFYGLMGDLLVWFKLKCFTNQTFVKENDSVVANENGSLTPHASLPQNIYQRD